MRRVLLLLVGVSLLVVSCVAGLANRQGLYVNEWTSYQGADIQHDARGIPTITAKRRLALYQAQGFVQASERLWQMDLMRRSASGHLSEWFGALALPSDRRHRQERWQAVAQAAYKNMPASQMADLDAFTLGVNKFIEQYPGRWGIEYVLLGGQPKPWQPSDSLLIALMMTETLTRLDHYESNQSIWRKHLTGAWAELIFPRDHPWNVPLVGQAGKMQLPPKAQWLKQASVEITDAQIAQPYVVGSNNWAWAGQGKAFLANDPHLGLTVPNVWYAMRLYYTEDDWVVGASIPGIPGIVLGMNEKMAWSFTNRHEDVDDLLEETLNEDLTQYQVIDDQGGVTWKDIQKTSETINIRGEASQTVEVWQTHRGPLMQRRAHGDTYFSRAWIAFKPGMLSIPTFSINDATDWASFNLAIDAMKVPSQNIIMMDRMGNIGYRSSGIGIQRAVIGNRIQPANKGEWLGFDDMSERLRLWLPAAEKPQWLATANQRIEVKPFAHGYAGDERVQRLRSVLAGQSHFSLEQMESLQLDTQSRFHQLVLHWVAKHVSSPNALTQKWLSWDGDATTDTVSFTQAEWLSHKILKILIARVRLQLLPEAQQDLLYAWRVGQALTIGGLTMPDALSVFGIQDSDLADQLLAAVQAQTLVDYKEENLWQAQHPLAGVIPVLGRFFLLPKAPQVGNRWVVRAESTKFGPSMRMIWDLFDQARVYGVFLLVSQVMFARVILLIFSLAGPRESTTLFSQIKAKL